MNPRDENVLAFVWYTADEYAKLLDNSDDPEGLFDSYETWKEDAQNAFDKYREMGFEPRKLRIDVDEMIEWCDNRDRPLNRASRQMFKKIKRASFYASMTNS